MPRTCAKCGSKSVLAPVTVSVNAGDAGRQNVVLEVQKDPYALLFKERVMEPLRAALCGDCGNVEFYVENQVRLVEAHEEARRS